ncbi:MAG TPA: helix-turn-helix domain-containing protein [Nocardioidaceae bacterium]|nr:helix-turn-helix domain-containing protein [Nocardioidaceae bacterium]
MKNTRRIVGLTEPRATLLELLSRQPDPVSIDAIVQKTGRHANTVREQLNWLVKSGLVDRSKAFSEGRGRPAWLYFVPGDRPEQDEYAELAAALAWQVSEGSADPAAEGRVAGRRWGRQICEQRGIERAATAREGRAVTVDVMDELGYAPQSDARHDKVLLRRCPLLEAAHQHPDVVCSTHLGLVQAVAEGAGADPTRVELIPFAEPGGCRLRLLKPQS